MKKKTISLLLALALVLSLLPITALASYVPEGNAVPEFTASINGENLPVVLADPEGYPTFTYDESWNKLPGNPVPLYTVAVPAGATTVDLKFSAYVLAYNYSLDGGFIAGNYADIKKGVASVTVSVDYDHGQANDQGVDFIQVQTPYVINGYDYSSTVLYAITFQYPVPFTAYAGETELKGISAKDNGYPPDGGSPVTLYTVPVPKGTENVQLKFADSEKLLAYN